MADLIRHAQSFVDGVEGAIRFPSPELLEQRPQGMPRDDDVHRAIAPEDE